MLNYDHIVIVVMENHSYQEIVSSKEAVHAPYINNTLAKEGISINNAYGEQHPSQPNYFWLFSGSNQGIQEDQAYWPSEQPGPVFSTPNLYTALEERFSTNKSNFFRGYVDGYPVNAGMPNNYYSNTGNYANRHVPWLGFKNINDGHPEAPCITNIFESDFPGADGNAPDFSKLPVVSMVIPGLNHDMHDYDGSGSGSYVNSVKESNEAVKHGDAWLEKYIGPYATWAKKNNSLLVVTWDEDSSTDWVTPVDLGGGGTFKNAHGLTAPNLKANDQPIGSSGPNQIPMFFYGANLATSGSYTAPGAGINNINLLRTIESIYGLAKSGKQTPVAESAGMTDEPIPGIFTFPY
jgi:acid phosphatase